MAAPPARPQNPGWDIFCRVIDNHGDAGVCWRLAAELATRGQSVRLFIDDAHALAWMAPAGHTGVQVLPFDQAARMAPGNVVIEAFGCDPPAGYVQAMAATRQAPVWVNLEYLSAEPYVERCHTLPSPQRNGLLKWFFYPGFSTRTGGLLREAGLAPRQASFQRDGWLQAQGITRQPGERLVSLFCYADPPPAHWPVVLQALAAQPTRLLLTPTAQTLLHRAPPQWPDTLQTHALPWLSQTDYDHLLWACDLNFVRGEDSLVRAHWAGAPFVWHIYPQHDGVHAGKLDALLQRMGASPDVAALWQAWNGTGPRLHDSTLAALLQPEGLRAWRTATAAWRDSLLAQADLVTQLAAFVQTKAKGAWAGPGPTGQGQHKP